MTLPAVFFTIITAYFFIPLSKNPRLHKLDWQGTLCIFAGLFGIAFGLISGPSGWTSPAVLLSLTGGLVACIIFIIVELHVKEPLMPLQIFKNPLVTVTNLATLFLYFCTKWSIISHSSESTTSPGVFAIGSRIRFVTNSYIYNILFCFGWFTR